MTIEQLELDTLPNLCDKCNKCLGDCDANPVFSIQLAEIYGLGNQVQGALADKVVWCNGYYV